MNFRKVKLWTIPSSRWQTEHVKLFLPYPKISLKRPKTMRKIIDSVDDHRTKNSEKSQEAGRKKSKEKNHKRK